MTEIEVGRIAGLFGVRGELKCDPTSAGRIVFSEGAVLRCELEDRSWTVKLTHVRPHKGRLLVRIEGAGDTTTAASYLGARLYAPRDAVKLDPGEYFDEDLVGCAVLGIDGTSFGSVERLEHYPSSDMLVVAGHLVPMVGAIVREIDLTQRRIVIDPPEGLMSS